MQHRGTPCLSAIDDIRDECPISPCPCDSVRETLQPSGRCELQLSSSRRASHRGTQTRSSVSRGGWHPFSLASWQSTYEPAGSYLVAESIPTGDVWDGNLVSLIHASLNTEVSENSYLPPLAFRTPDRLLPSLPLLPSVQSSFRQRVDGTVVCLTGR